MSNHPPYTPPAYHAAKFHCPHCHAYSAQIWSRTCDSLLTAPNGYRVTSPADITISRCVHCEESCLWLDQELIIPGHDGVPPNDDMSEGIKKIYKEAGDISQKSPRASAALLRLALQMLCKELGGKGENINEDIQRFIKDNVLSAEVTDSMDAVRLTGNHAVHPGEINFNDNSGVVNILFELINFIAEDALTKPRERAERLARINALTGKTTEQED